MVDVQFKDQVIATRKGTWTIGVDSAKVKEAFKTLMDDSKPDTIEMSSPKKQVVVRENSAEPKIIEKQKAADVKVEEKKVKPEVKEGENIPKAVMQKKE
jgi:hypothetical protein